MRRLKARWDRVFGRSKSAPHVDAAVDKLGDGRPWNLSADKWFFRWPPPFSLLLPPRQAAASEASLMSDANAYGAAAGSAAGRGEHFAAHIPELPGRRVIEFISDQRVARVKQNADAIGRDLDTQLAGLESKLRTAEQDEQLTEESHGNARRERAESPQTVHRNSRSDAGLYAVVLAVLACAEFPTIYVALQSSPLPGWAILMITGALSAIIALSAAIVGEYLCEFVASVDDAREDNLSAQKRTERVLKAIIAAGIFIVMIVLMVVMFSIRTDLFAAQTEVANPGGKGAGSEGLKLSVLLLLLQLLFFVIAFAMAFLRSRGAEKRRENSVAFRRARRLDAELADAKARLDMDRQIKVSLEAQIQTLKGLRESVIRAEKLELECEAAVRGEALKRHDNQYESAEHSGLLRG